MRRLSVVRLSFVLLVASVVACSEQGPSSSEAKGETLSRAERIALGARLYQKNCAICHGAQAEGAPNWRQRDIQGHFPPPPLNGTGHAWHHPRVMLQQVIRNGSMDGSGRMPAWRNRLDEDEIAAIIDWFQSRWPDEVYAAWAEIDARSAQ